MSAATRDRSSGLRRAEPRVLLSSVACDAHTWNLVYLHLLLEEFGCTVENLGACTPDAAVADGIERFRPDLLVVSSVNGHGAMDAVRLFSGLRNAGLSQRCHVVVGGKLGVAGPLAERERQALLRAGADEVLGEDVDALGRAVATVRRRMSVNYRIPAAVTVTSGRP